MLYKITEEKFWLKRAEEFAQKALAYRSIIEGSLFGPRTQSIAFQPISLTERLELDTFSCERRIHSNSKRR